MLLQVGSSRSRERYRRGHETGRGYQLPGTHQDTESVVSAVQGEGIKGQRSEEQKGHLLSMPVRLPGGRSIINLSPEG